MDQPPAGGQPPDGPRAPDWGDMKGKLAAAKGPERLILIAGLLFFIDSFLPWYGFGGFNVSGWNSGGLAVIAILLGLAATLLVLAATVGMQIPVQTTGALLLGLCGGALLFTVLRFVTETRLTKYGLYLAIVFTAVMAYGAWQRYKSAA